MTSFVLATLPRVHLYAAYLGGDLGPGRMGEDHEVVFVVAGDEPAARRAAKAKWGGDGRPHVDALTGGQDVRTVRAGGRRGGQAQGRRAPGVLPDDPAVGRREDLLGLLGSSSA